MFFEESIDTKHNFCSMPRMKLCLFNLAETRLKFIIDLSFNVPYNNIPLFTFRLIIENILHTMILGVN